MLHWYNLHWNGPASLAMVVDTPDAEVTLAPSSLSRAVVNVEALAEVAVRATILKTGYIDAEAASEAEISGARSSSRAVLDVDIAARPSAEDIAQAVWGASLAINQQSGSMARAMKVMSAIAANRVVTDPAAGTFTVYDDDSTTVLASGLLWQDAAGTTPYAGAGAERRDRLT